MSRTAALLALALLLPSPHAIEGAAAAPLTREAKASPCLERPPAPGRPSTVTAAEKKAFVAMLKKLPTRGEFYTDEAVEKAAPHTRVLLALTEKDLAKFGATDIYPFAALSRGLCDLKAPRQYAVEHFGEIAHPTLKLFWAGMLFDAKVASPPVVAFLRAALKSKEQSKLLAEIKGPSFEDFKKRVLAHKAKGKERGR